MNREERIFTLSDIRRFFQKKKPSLLRLALFTWVLTFGFLLLKKPQYKAEATFKDGGEKSDSESTIKDLLLGSATAGGTQPQATALMKSFQVLKPLIAKLGLQASLAHGGLVTKVCTRLRDNLKAERRKPLEDPDTFSFRNIEYEGEYLLTCSLTFDSPEDFSILEGKKVVAKGRVGQEVKLPAARFTLSKTPRWLRLHHPYTLQFTPWIPLAKQLRSQLQINSHKNNKMIYNIAFCNRDRHLATHLVNELMTEYQRYLKREHDRVAEEQLIYLERKQEEIYKKMGDVLNEYAAYLSKNVGKGFLGFEHEAKNLFAPYQELTNKIFAIDLELGRIDLFEKEGKWTTILSEESAISRLIQDLKQQRDLLELSLQQRTPFSHEQLFLRSEELEKIRSQREMAKELLAKSNQKDFLENHLRLLSVREKMIQDHLFYTTNASREFEGIDLITTRSLFVDYNKKFDQCEASMRYLAQLKDEIETNSEFELSSLSAVLRDALSQELIAQAGKLALLLKDEKHHSEREGERWREELSLQKKILSEHLDQLYQVEKLNASLVQEKIVKLQEVALDCIYRQTSILQEQATDLIRERRAKLLKEKALLEEKAKELEALAAGFPEKWKLEKWLTLKKEMVVQMVGTLTQLVESKTIGQHLHHVGSKPLDFAVLPLAPVSPYLFRFAFLSAFAVSLGSFLFSLMRKIVRGFPPSLEKLRAMNLPLSGEVSPHCDGSPLESVRGEDLELLRKIALFLKTPPHAKTIALFSGNGPDYSYALAENLGKTSLCPLLIRCDFSQKFKESPGLLQFWKEEIATPPIQTKQGFDLVLSGGFTPYGVELIQSTAFQNLLHSWQQKYDILLLFFRSPLFSSETIAALRLVDKAIATVSTEPDEELTPLLDWAYHEGNNRLTFVVSPS